VRTIAIVNQKGGCGKTTTAINLASICAKRGLRTLLVDMDPQSHCAAGLGVPEEGIENHIGRAMISDLSRGLQRESLVWEVARNLDLAPSTMALAALEAPGGGLHGLEDRDRRLAQVLRWLAPHYDRCLIDCPPTIGLLTYNALRAAGEAIIPVETGFFALRGARKQWETIQNLVDRVNHPISCYVLPTLYDATDRIARNILGSIRRQFGGRVIPIVIRNLSIVREAAGFGQPVIEYAPESEAMKDFAALADWLDDHPADPPEISRDVTRAVTVPWSQPAERMPALNALPQGALHSPARAGVCPAPAVPDSTGGSRAAEMAQRMRDLAGNRQRHQEATNALTSLAIDIARPLEDTLAPAADSRAPLHLGAEVHAVREARNRQVHMIETKSLPAPIADIQSNLMKVFGARQTAQGVMFVQPGAPSMSVSIAGVFNGWSPLASPMRYNAETGAFELIVPLPRGEHEYRVIVDGKWQADPYNFVRRRNGFGEENSIVIVQ
jgi:chromosome partitioning protein